MDVVNNSTRSIRTELKTQMAKDRLFQEMNKRQHYEKPVGEAEAHNRLKLEKSSGRLASARSSTNQPEGDLAEFAQIVIVGRDRE